MDAFARLLVKWKTTIAANVAAHGVPPQPKLFSFIGANIVPSLKRATARAPGPVKDSIKSAFSENNWDVVENDPVGDGPTIESLTAALDTLIAEFPTPDGSGAGAGAGADSKEPEADTEPTEHELEDTALAASRMWELSDRLEYGKDYTIDLQKGTKPYKTGDRASAPLFSYVREGVFAPSTTYAACKSLLDNYVRETGVAEVRTRAEEAEEKTFLRTCMKTPVMQYAYKWLKAKRLVGDSEDDFMRTLSRLWFKLYRRETRGDSSGFEHVFCGEEKDGKVSGCHNWIQLYNEEKKGNLNYLGFIPPRRSRSYVPDEESNIITIQFEWEGERKPVSTSFVGVDPAFELALYSLIFLQDDDGDVELPVEMGGHALKIRAYRIGRGMIGTAFPDAD